ncbi:ABC transporter substrate-binding protein [uncultured Thiohalocapsa sp.]|uniref:ABC transporter substrate-binding protein n=1 Tax=uncultured Thiohalocapsa sp. TaxID=768990 RepID=UPI0025EF4A98|nr:ABC transporter substrate-binding protein [uncultured Thiohalocapsa sp.]
MNTNRTLALGLAAIGLLLIVAGPLLPGGERALVNDPPRTGHVTDLARADDGSILAGTQDGELWRLADGTWAPVDVDLGGAPVTALAADLSGDPSKGPIGTGAGLVNAPGTLPPITVRVSDESATAAGLVVATGDGLLVEADGDWQRQLPGVHVYRLEPQRIDGTDYLHAGTVDAGVYTAPVSDLAGFSPNSDGLPQQGNVFSFVITAGGRLVAGTSKGLYWQEAPMQPWQPLKVGLEQSRMLSLHLEPERGDTQRLWIGSDDGLFSVALTEDDAGVTAAAYAEPAAGPDDGLRYGVSWIVPFEDGVMFSSGGVYQFGSFGLPGWYWISLLGVVLLLLGGWLFPARDAAPASAGNAPD